MRTLRLAHAWAGLALCLLLAVLGLSGALLVFKADFLRATLPGASAPFSTDAARLGAALETIEGRYRGEGLTYVVLGSPQMALHQVGLGKGGGAYVDQTGAEVARWTKNARIEEWLFDLHHYLLAGETGMIIAGLAGLCAVVMILSGLILWLPAAPSFGWRLWPQSWKRRDLLAHHRDLGVVLSAPLMIFVLTGAALVFPDQSRAILNVVTFSLPPPALQKPKVNTGDIDWRSTLTPAMRQFPDAEPRIVSWPKTPNAPVAIRVRQGAEWHPNGRTIVHINPETGAIIGVVNAQSLPGGARAFNAVYPLHAAKIGGHLYDALAVLAGCGLGLLSLLAGLSYWRKLFAANAHDRQAEPGQTGS
jgi:uncharacterized iron-regulated membrane protein